MKQKLRITNTSNHLLKLFSVVFGYLLWLAIANNQRINKTFEIPLCFYSLKDNFDIIAPEKIFVTLIAKRSDLYNIDIHQAAVAHIDASTFVVGQQNIEIKENDIFLHNKIKLIDYYPSKLSIQIKEKK